MTVEEVKAYDIIAEVLTMTFVGRPGQSPLLLAGCQVGSVVLTHTPGGQPGAVRPA